VNKLYLGRPWRGYSKTAFIRCQLPKQLAPEGWNNWGNPENEKTAFYAEYKNTGEGAATKSRVAWSKQLNDKEAKDYIPETIFSTNNSTVQQDANWFQNLSSKPFEWPVTKK
jgi:pectinesterase